MPGYFDPVAASFVYSILSNYDGYTLFERLSPQTALVLGAGATARTTINGAVGLTRIPNALLIHMRAHIVASVNLTANRRAILNVYETGAGPVPPYSAIANLYNGLVAASEDNDSVIGVIPLNVLGQFDWEGVADAQLTPAFGITRLAVIY